MGLPTQIGTDITMLRPHGSELRLPPTTPLTSIQQFADEHRYGSTMTRHGKTLLVPVLISSALLAACGGDSGSSSSDEAFCKEIEQLENLDIETDIAAEILAELAQNASNAEVRDALDLIAPIFERPGSIDQADESAMMAILDEMSSPEVNAASEVLDTYGSEVCGFDDAEDSASTDTTP